jgi:hypothetical protein
MMPMPLRDRSKPTIATAPDRSRVSQFLSRPLGPAFRPWPGPTSGQPVASPDLLRRVSSESR